MLRSLEGFRVQGLGFRVLGFRVNFLKLPYQAPDSKGGRTAVAPPLESCSWAVPTRNFARLGKLDSYANKIILICPLP